MLRQRRVMNPPMGEPWDTLQRFTEACNRLHASVEQLEKAVARMECRQAYIRTSILSVEEARNIIRI